MIKATRKFFLLLFLTLCVSVLTPLSAYDLLIIDSQNSEPYIPVREAFVKELARRGFISGENLNIKYWSLANSYTMARRAWITEKNTHYDLIFLNGTTASLNFHKFAYGDFRYRFLFGAVTDPVGLGLIKNFTSPPIANFTGIAYPVKVRDRLRFIKQVFPQARDIGLVYADMTQSQSYRIWLDKILKEPEFSDLHFHYRIVEFVPGDTGYKRMAMLSKEYIEQLDREVDIFLTPNDQMGVESDYARVVTEATNKPLVGLGRKDVMENWGAVASIYPSLDEMGIQLAVMAEKLLKGAPIRKVQPAWPKTGIAFNLKKAEELGITIPPEMVKSAGENVVR